MDLTLLPHKAPFHCNIILPTKVLFLSRCHQEKGKDQKSLIAEKSRIPLKFLFVATPGGEAL